MGYQISQRGAASRLGTDRRAPSFDLTRAGLEEIGKTP